MFRALKLLLCWSILAFLGGRTLQIRNCITVSNFIRSQIIPRIESEFPEFGSRIENMRQLIADDEELLKALCLSHISEVEGKNANSWQLAKLESLPSALKEECSLMRSGAGGLR